MTTTTSVTTTADGHRVTATNAAGQTLDALTRAFDTRAKAKAYANSIERAERGLIARTQLVRLARFTRTEIAAKLGVSVSAVSRWAASKSVPTAAGVAKLVALADASACYDCDRGWKWAGGSCVPCQGCNPKGKSPKSAVSFPSN